MVKLLKLFLWAKKENNTNISSTNRLWNTGFKPSGQSLSYSFSKLSVF